MFLDSGDGIVFVGEFGPWYSEERREFHLPPTEAEKLLRGTIETYKKQDGRPLKEIFLHARSGIDKAEYEGFLQACPAGVKLIAIRVRQDRNGLRLFRYDDHPNVVKRGQHPVQRGIFWHRAISLMKFDDGRVKIPRNYSISQSKMSSNARILLSAEES